MFTKQLPTVLVITTFFLLTFFAFQSSVLPAVADVATYVVISEVQVGGSSAADEFVELYNPTDTPVDLTGWRLHRKSSGAANNDLVASMSGMIPAHGYFLIAPDTFDGGVEVDQSYTTASIATNNTISLFDHEDSLVDRLGFGGATDFEGSASANPANNGSLERKALATSTLETMKDGGEDEDKGNGEDTDYNFNDFIVREVSEPQNSSVTEVLVVTPTPTAEPTMTPTPTVEPTATPEPTISPTPTAEPTSTPTAEPTPSVTPSPTVTPTPEPGEVIFRGRLMVCRLTYLTIRTRFSELRWPIVRCGLERAS